MGFVDSLPIALYSPCSTTEKLHNWLQAPSFCLFTFIILLRKKSADFFSESLIAKDYKKTLWFCIMELLIRLTCLDEI